MYTNNAVDTTLIMQVPISLNNEDSIIETKTTGNMAATPATRKDLKLKMKI